MKHPKHFRDNENDEFEKPLKKKKVKRNHFKNFYECEEPLYTDYKYYEDEDFAYDNYH